MSLGADITKFLTCNAPSWFCVACITREVILTPPNNIDHVRKFVRQQIETGALSAFEASHDAAAVCSGCGVGGTVEHPVVRAKGQPSKRTGARMSPISEPRDRER